MIKYGVLIICFFNCVVVEAQDKPIPQYQGFPLLKNYPVKELAGQVFSIAQDNSGILYFAMDKGVVQYDGTYWREINELNQIPIFSLCKDGDTIYVGGADEFGYLAIDSNKRISYKSLKQLLPDSIKTISSVRLVKSTQQYIYFHTLYHLFQFDKQTKKIHIFNRSPETLDGSFVLNDTYYYWENAKGLSQIQHQKVEPAPGGDFFKNKKMQYANSIFDTSQQLIITNNFEFFIYQNRNGRPKEILFKDDNFALEKENIIYRSIKLNKQKQWLLSSLFKGCVLMDEKGNTLQRYNQKIGLPSDVIYAIYEDTNQNLWLGSEAGISKTEQGKDLTYWNHASGYKGDLYSMLLYQNKLLVLTNQEIFYLNPTHKSLEFVNSTGVNLQKWDVKDIQIEGQSKLMITAGGSLIEIKGNKTEVIASTTFAKFFLHQHHQEPRRLITTYGKTLISFLYQNHQWIPEGEWQGIEKESIRKIAETRQGEFWLGTRTAGVIKVIPNLKNITQPLKVVYYGIEQGLPSLNRCVPFVYKDNILIGTEKGLYIYVSQKDRFEPYCELGRQFCDGSMGVYHFVESADDKIFIAPYKGHASCVKLEKNGVVKWIFEPFRRMPSMRIDKIEVDAAGVVWIGGGEGIFRYDARQDTKDYKKPFHCLIRKVLINEDSVLFLGNDKQRPKQQNLPIKLPYQYHDIKFEFAAPFFDQEDKTRYSYYLEGGDKNWSNWSTQTEKEYTNLWEGTYTFQAKAKNIYGVESIVGVYSFTVLPPWYRAWWAIVLYAACIIIAITFIIKIYHYRLIRKKIKLQRIIKERTLKINEQNSELHSQKQKLEIQTTQLTKAIETKDKLFAILGHDLRAPINSLAGLMDLVSQKSISPHILQLYTDKLKINVKQVHFTLNNLLFWATGQMQGLVINAQVVPLFVLVENNFSLAQEIAISKRIGLVNVVPQELAVWADKDHVDIVLRNLLNNAIKFTPQDGTIRIAAIAKGNHCEISVQDSGVGITDEILAKIFSTNVATSIQGTNGEKGTGLGLSVCKELIEMNGGKIWIESQILEGTKVCFTLPVKN